MMKSLICLSLILLPLIALVEGSASSKNKSVSITDVSAPNIKEVAKYAIDEHNSETNDNLVLVKIVNAKKREVSATIYDLIIAARDVGGATKNYEAVVMESGRDKILYSFNAV